MAEKRTIELEVNSNLGTLKKQLKEAKAAVLSLSQEFGHTSLEATNAANKAAELKLQISEGNKLIKAFNPAQSLNSATSAMGGVKESIGLVGTSFKILGGESEEAAIAMEKVGLAMEFTAGISSLHESAASFKILGAVIKSTSLYQRIYNFVTTGSLKAVALQTAAKVADTEATVAQGTAMVATTAATTGASKAAKILRIALISTGVGALVVAVGLLIANFDAVKTAIVGAYDKFNKLGPVIKGVIMVIFPLVGLFVGIGKALEYFGVIDDETTRKNKANAEARTKAVEKESDRIARLAKRKQKHDDEKYTHEINLAKASGKEVYEMELKKAKAHLASGRVFLAEQNKKIKAYREEIEMLIATGDADSDRVKSLKKSLTNAKKLATESYLDNKATKNALEVMQVEHATELANKAKNAGAKAKEKRDELAAQELADLKAKQEKENALIEEMRLNRLSAESKELEALNLAYKAKIDIAKGMGEKGLELVKELETKQGIEAAAITKKYADLAKVAKDENDKLEKERLATEKAFLQELTKSEAELKLIKLGEEYKAQQLLYKDNAEILAALDEKYLKDKEALTTETNAKIAASDKEAADKKQDLLNSQLDAVKQGLSSIANIAELFAGKSKASQKRAFNVQKATNIATATIDTFMSAQSAYKSLVGVPVVGPVIAPIAAAGAIAAGLINIKKIKATKFEGGETPSASSGVGGDIGSGGATQAPQFNVVGNNGMNQLAQLQQQPIQAYVVSSEMTSAQALERNRINNATI
jgi:hypothetical protein